MRSRLFGPGELRLTLLALIRERPRHGYDLIRELEERSQGAYRPSAGSIYPTLQLLQDEGLAESEPQGAKRIYRATEAGRRTLDEESETLDRIWRRASRFGETRIPLDPDALEIARPVQRLVSTAFRAVARYGVDPERVREILEHARQEIREQSGRDDS